MIGYLMSETYQSDIHLNLTAVLHLITCRGVSVSFVSTFRWSSSISVYFSNSSAWSSINTSAIVLRCVEEDVQNSGRRFLEQ
ncbi:hypothetical protein VNO80_02509 [Phaseolus coccineus]|uniref:Uncharacterized protein n=1 Tax=Phaseolus coccineus TaxID=3886 RepID=A0AAN9RMF8_PHACN